MSTVAILTRILVKNAQERPTAWDIAKYLAGKSRAGMQEMRNPRMFEQSFPGVANTFAHGLTRGTQSFASHPVNPWSSIGEGAQLAGVATRTAVDPSNVYGGVATLATLLARNAARRREPDAAWGQNVNPNPDRDFQRQLEQQQRGR